MKRALLALILCLLAATARAQTSPTLMPLAHLQFLDNNGRPVSSGSIETYAAGTSTPLAAYSDATLQTALPTTIRLNTAGRPQTSGGTETAVWLAPQPYKLILKSSTGATIWTADNILAATAPTRVTTVTTTCTVSFALSPQALYLANANGGGFTCTLPTAVGNSGKSVTIKKIDTTTNRITIATTGGQTIDGNTNAFLKQSLQQVTFVSDGSNWRVTSNDYGPRSVYAYGATCSGAVDDTAAFTASIAAQGLAYVPFGTCAINLTISDSNVRVFGQSAGTVSPLSSSLRAFSPSSPIITIKNTSANVSGVHLDNLAFEASNGTGTGTIGLSLEDGAAANFYNALSFNGFTTYAIKVQAGTSRSVSQNFFQGVQVTVPSSQTAGIFISEPASGAQHTTTTWFSDARFTMNGNTSGDLLQVDSSDVHLTQAHFQCTNGHCLNVKKTYSNTPFVYAADLTLDSNSGSDVLLTVYTTTKEVSQYVRGTFLIDGLLQYSDASTLALNTSTAPMIQANRAQRYGWNLQVATSTSVGGPRLVLESTTSSGGVANSTTMETDLFSYTLPANAMDATGTQITCESWGTYASNGNTKVLKLYAGGQVVHTSTTTQNGTGWWATWVVTRRASMSQRATGRLVQTAPSVSAVSSLTLDDTASQIFKITGTGDASSDILGFHLSCYWEPEKNYGQN